MEKKKNNIDEWNNEIYPTTKKENNISENNNIARFKLGKIEENNRLFFHAEIGKWNIIVESGMEKYAGYDLPHQNIMIMKRKRNQKKLNKNNDNNCFDTDLDGILGQTAKWITYKDNNMLKIMMTNKV